MRSSVSAAAETLQREMRELGIECGVVEEIRLGVRRTRFDRRGVRAKAKQRLLECARDMRGSMGVDHAYRKLVAELEEEDRREVLSIDDLAFMFHLDTWEEIQERAAHNVFDNAHTGAEIEWKDEHRYDDNEQDIDERWDALGEDAKNELIWKEEERILDEGFREYTRALHSTIDDTFRALDLQLVPVRYKPSGSRKYVESNWDFVLTPTGATWEQPARNLWQALTDQTFDNLRDFLGFGTPRDAVLDRLSEFGGLFNSDSRRRFERNFSW